MKTLFRWIRFVLYLTLVSRKKKKMVCTIYRTIYHVVYKLTTFDIQSLIYFLDIGFLKSPYNVI